MLCRIYQGALVHTGCLCYCRLVPSQLAHFIRSEQGDSDHGLHGSIQNLHILAGIFSLDFLYLDGKSPWLMGNIKVNFGDILPKTSKSSSFLDMGVYSHLKWLFLFSPDKAGELGWHQSSVIQP